MWSTGRYLLVVLVLATVAAALPLGIAEAKAKATPRHSTGGAVTKPKPKPKPTVCTKVLGSDAVTGPTKTVAWKVALESRVGVFKSLPGKRLKPSQSVAPKDAPWLLVLARPRVADKRCWVLVRLPWRPNNAIGWINANHDVFIEKTTWRIVVSTARRTLTLFHRGKSVRTVTVVVGKPSTPTPTGLFAIAWAIPWHPNDFLGSWVLELTAHSNVLKQFDGGDGTVGIHGRGGTSLLDPLGSALSHGCIRLANSSIDWLVHTVGQNRILGTPVQVS